MEFYNFHEYFMEEKMDSLIKLKAFLTHSFPFQNEDTKDILPQRKYTQNICKRTLPQGHYQYHI